MKGTGVVNGHCEDVQMGMNTGTYSWWFTDSEESYEAFPSVILITRGTRSGPPVLPATVDCWKSANYHVSAAESRLCLLHGLHVTLISIHNLAFQKSTLYRLFKPFKAHQLAF